MVPVRFELTSPGPSLTSALGNTTLGEINAVDQVVNHSPTGPKVTLRNLAYQGSVSVGEFTKLWLWLLGSLVVVGVWSDRWACGLRTRTGGRVGRTGTRGFPSCHTCLVGSLCLGVI